MALAAAPASCWKIIERTSAWKRSIRGMIPSVPTSAMIRARTGSFLLRCKRADRAYGTLVGGIEVGRICHDLPLSINRAEGFDDRKENRCDERRWAAPDVSREPACRDAAWADSLRCLAGAGTCV